MKKHAFTLVELLITIGIIASRSCLLLPAIGSAVRKADQTKAKAEITALVTAISQFEATYGYLPYPTASYTEGNILSANQYEDLILILQGEDQKNSSYTRNPNPKKQRFLDVRGNTPGAYEDPWGNTYNVIFDKNANGKVEYASAADQPDALGLSHTNIYAGLIIWSDGAKVTKDSAYVFEDNVYSLPVEWDKEAKKFKITQ